MSLGIPPPYHPTGERAPPRLLLRPRSRSLPAALAGYAEQIRFRIWGSSDAQSYPPYRSSRYEESLWRTLGQTHGDNARYQNIQQRSCGHFWQARFYSCPMDHVHQWEALAYVERNPVRAGMVREAAQYRWSTRRHTVGRAGRRRGWI